MNMLTTHIRQETEESIEKEQKIGNGERKDRLGQERGILSKVWCKKPGAMKKAHKNRISKM